MRIYRCGSMASRIDPAVAMHHAVPPTENPRDTHGKPTVSARHPRLRNLWADNADRVVVLEFGKVIAEGAPEAIRKDPKVIATYLGDDLTDAALAGSTADSPEGIL